MPILWLAVVFYGLSIFSDPILYYPLKTLWPINRLTIGLNIFLAAFSVTLLMIWRLDVFTLLFLCISAYRIFNLLKVNRARAYGNYIQIAGKRSTIALIGLQLITIALWALWSKYKADNAHIWFILSLLQLIVSVVFLAASYRREGRTLWPSDAGSYPDKKLPDITVAIPARNETQDLNDCLQSVIESNYPKLEVLVFDDSSQNKRIPEIIRGFAHEGVRFIRGEESISSWLPKNQAYYRLYEEASSDFILYCGVDVRFSPDTIRQIIYFMQTYKKDMLSILPVRSKSSQGHFALFQSVRYWWELVPPRRFFNRPPVISSCWVIKKESLRKFGGFAAIKNSIMPEAYFAKQLLANDGYSFKCSSENLGLTSIKSTIDQRDTAIRLRYPQMHHRPENVFMVSLFEIIFLLMPFALFVASFWMQLGLARYLTCSTCLILTGCYEIVANETNVVSRSWALIGQPFIILTDILLLNYSMWKYEFSVVIWKGRYINFPALYAISRLPDLPADR